MAMQDLYALLEEVIVDYRILFSDHHFSNIELISGGAKGADELAERWAEDYDRKITVVRPNWDKYGLGAGYIRNQEMIDMKPYLVIAFWDGKSRGTSDTIRRAKKAKIQTLIVYF